MVEWWWNSQLIELTDGLLMVMVVKWLLIWLVIVLLIVHDGLMIVIWPLLWLFDGCDWWLTILSVNHLDNDWWYGSLMVLPMVNDGSQRLNASYLMVTWLLIVNGYHGRDDGVYMMVIMIMVFSSRWHGDFILVVILVVIIVMANKKVDSSSARWLNAAISWLYNGYTMLYSRHNNADIVTWKRLYTNCLFRNCRC